MLVYWFIKITYPNKKKEISIEGNSKLAQKELHLNGTKK